MKQVVIENPVLNSPFEVFQRRLFGRWDLFEISDPWDAQEAIREAIRTC